MGTQVSVEKATAEEVKAKEGEALVTVVEAAVQDRSVVVETPLAMASGEVSLLAVGMMTLDVEQMAT